VKLGGRERRGREDCDKLVSFGGGRKRIVGATHVQIAKLALELDDVKFLRFDKAQQGVDDAERAE
jgi:hypothetical protein